MARPLVITIDSRIRVPLKGLPLAARDELFARFTHPNPDRAKAIAMRRSMPWIKIPPDTIGTWKTSDHEISLPRGGMGRVREVLQQHGVAYSTEDRRQGGRSVKLLSSDVNQPWDFQREIVEAGAKREQGIVRSPTGSGKTSAAIALAARLSVQTLVIVWTESLLQQWLRRIALELVIDARDIGVVQGKRRDIGSPIVVGMQQTLCKLADQDLAGFGCVICDEVQKWGATTFMNVVDRMPARYRFGFSASEKRKDRKDFLIYDVFGDVIAEVDQRELEDRGIVHDVELRVVPTEFAAPWYESLKGEDRATPFHYTRLLQETVQNGPRNAMIARLAAEEAAAGETVLVFTHRVLHARRLLADVASMEPRVGLLLGAVPGCENDFETTRQGLASGAVRVGVGTYQAAGTGVDLPSVSVGICTTPIHTNRPFFGQVRGRVCRVDRSKGAKKTTARLYYLWDRRIYGLNALRNLTSWNRSSVVLVGDQWVDAKSWLKEQEASDATRKRGGGWFDDVDTQGS